jgi:hypothetical protein
MFVQNLFLIIAGYFIVDGGGDALPGVLFGGMFRFGAG